MTIFSMKFWGNTDIEVTDILLKLYIHSSASLARSRYFDFELRQLAAGIKRSR